MLLLYSVQEISVEHEIINSSYNSMAFDCQQINTREFNNLKWDF